VQFVRGYDEANPSKGAIFELPITLVVPYTVPVLPSSCNNSRELSLPLCDLAFPNERIRKFIVPPQVRNRLYTLYSITTNRILYNRILHNLILYTLYSILYIAYISNTYSRPTYTHTYIHT
jgi:hypothetical protein